MIVRLHLCKRRRIMKVVLVFSIVSGTTLNDPTHKLTNGFHDVSEAISLKKWWHVNTEKWHPHTLSYEPGHIFVMGNIPLSGFVSRNWCLATTLGINFWVWCDLWRLHCGNSFNILQFIGSNIALINKLVFSLETGWKISWVTVYSLHPFQFPLQWR